MTRVTQRTAQESGPGTNERAARRRRKLLNLAIFVGMGGVAFWTLLLVNRFTSTSTPGAVQEPRPAAQAPERPSAPEEAPQAQVPAHAQLGINLSGLADGNTELPFLDVFKLSRPWVSQKNDQPWGSGPPLALDPHGWVTRLDPGCYVETLLCTIDGGHYPAGTYTLLYEGEGELDLSGSASAVTREPGKITLEVQPAKGTLFLKIRSTKPNNYVRNIRVLLPGGLERIRENPWNPAFLKRWEGIACVRFMDWMITNGSKVRSWGDRPRLEDASFATRGAPAEVMFDLCNRLKADAWICMPHLADDDYIRRFAQLAKEKLDRKRRIYVEYSNELWNSGFEQCKHAIEEGRRQGLGQPAAPWEGGWKFTAMRSAQIFKVWKEVFGEGPRLVRVLPSQAANAYISRQIMEYQDAYRSADALAVAPYITLTVGPEAQGDRGEMPGARTVNSWTVDQVLNHVERVSLPQAVTWMREQKKAASERGLRLVAYEAGQHLVGILGAENDEKLTALLISANAHPRMKDIYGRYLDAWTKEGGDLLCHFNSMCRWDKWGSWGLLQFGDEDAARSPKFSATMHWAKALGQPVFVPK
jgi:hypothetical protein